MPAIGCRAEGQAQLKRRGTKHVSGLGLDYRLHFCALCLYKRSQLQTSELEAFLRRIIFEIGIRLLVVPAEITKFPRFSGRTLIVPRGA